jgi:hypothetical protein
VAQDPSPPLTLPLTLTANSCLSEDYLLTADILVDEEASSPVAVWRSAAGVSEALVIESGQLSHVYRDPSSDSARDVRPVAVGLDVGEVVAAKDGDGAVNAFLLDSANQLHQLRQDPVSGEWADPADLGCKATTIGIAQLAQWVDGEESVAGLVVYGVTSEGHLLLVTKDAKTGAWEHQEYADRLAGVPLQLVPELVFTDTWTLSLFAIIDGELRSKSFNPALQSYPQEWTGFVNIGESTRPKGVVALVGVPGVYSTLEIPTSHIVGVPLVAIDADNTLYTIHCSPSQTPGEAGSAAFNPVAGVEPGQLVKAGQVAATRQASDATLMQVYFIDTEAKLWVLRQSGVVRSGTVFVPTWYTPVPLGDHLLRVFTPAGANDQAEAFAIDTASTLCSLAQDPSTTQWTAVRIERSAPPDEPAHVSSYLTTASLVDVNGVPAAQSEVAITSCAPATIWVNGTAFDIGPNEPASCQTDLTGKLNVMSLAMGLDTPSLTFAAQGLDQPTKVAPYQAVHDYLAGSGTLNDLPAFDSNALQQAKDADNQPLANLTPAGAQAVAEGIKQTMSLRPPSSLTATASSPAPGLGEPLLAPGGEPAAGWSLDFTDPASPIFKPMTSAQLAAHRAQLEGRLVGSIWDDLKRFAGDVWHAIKTTAMKLETLVVDATNKAVSLTLSIAGQIAQLTDVAIKSVEDAVRVVHTIFAAIGAEVERVIEWLRALFNWGDILNTYKVLRHFFEQAVPQLQAVITNHAQPLVKGFFTRLEEDIKQHCEELKSLLEQVEDPNKKLTLADLGSGKLKVPNGDSPTVAQESFDPRAFHSHPQHNWFFDKLLANSHGVSGLELSVGDPLKQAFETFLAALKSALADFQAALEKLESFIKGVVRHPSDWKQLVVEDLINVIEDILVGELTVADGIIEALLDLINAALAALDSLLKAGLKIPLLSSLFKKITGDDLTVMRLWAMLMAMPMTLTYKLLQGVKEQLFTDDMVAELTTPSEAAKAALAASADVGPDENEQELSRRLGFASAGVQALWAVNDAFVDTVDIPDDKPPPLGQQAAIVLWGFVGVALPVAAQLLWWPNDSGDLRKGTPKDTQYHKWNLAMWALYWPPPVIDSLLLAGTLTKWYVPEWQNAPLLKMDDPAGKIFIAILGWGIEAASIGASIEGTKHDQMSPGYPPLGGWDIAANITGPLSYAGQVLLLDSIKKNPYWGPICVPLQLANDLITGELCAASMYYGTIS